MRLKFTPLLLCAWLLSPALTWAQTPATEASPAAYPPADTTGPHRAQITVGDLFRKDRDFKNAEAAYLRALQSADPGTREKALRSLERSLKQRHDYAVLFGQALRGMGEWIPRVMPIALLLASGWGGGGMGRQMGGPPPVRPRRPGQSKPRLRQHLPSGVSESLGGASARARTKTGAIGLEASRASNRSYSDD